jgi:hypothetical protein
LVSEPLTHSLRYPFGVLMPSPMLEHRSEQNRPSFRMSDGSPQCSHWRRNSLLRIAYGPPRCPGCPAWRRGLRPGGHEPRRWPYRPPLRHGRCRADSRVLFAHRALAARRPLSERFRALVPAQRLSARAAMWRLSCHGSSAFILRPCQRFRLPIADARWAIVCRLPATYYLPVVLRLHRRSAGRPEPGSRAALRHRRPRRRRSANSRSPDLAGMHAGPGRGTPCPRSDLRVACVDVTCGTKAGQDIRCAWPGGRGRVRGSKKPEGGR